MLEAYAESLAQLIAWLTGLTVVGDQVLGPGFVLQFDRHCTAVPVTLSVALSAAAMTPGGVRWRLATGGLIAVAAQATNLLRLWAIAWAGQTHGPGALLLIHDWIGPLAIAGVMAATWTLGWRALSNRRHAEKLDSD